MDEHRRIENRQKRVPLGVTGIIYESRPNVTTDAASLAFKSGNAVILRGGKEAFFSNQLLVQLLAVLANLLMPSSLSMILLMKLQDS